MDAAHIPKKCRVLSQVVLVVPVQTTFTSSNKYYFFNF